eukprot:gene602-330_t
MTQNFSPISAHSPTSPKDNFVWKQKQISFVKACFSEQLEQQLGLVELQAPLLTAVGDGIQDNLSGTEKAVAVKVKTIPENVYEVVHSLAKWKRKTLGEREFPVGEGIYTHMRALRPDEERLSPIHSVMVDQWDWELVMRPEDRNIEFLKSIVQKIYAAIKATEKAIADKFKLTPFLPDTIAFLHTEELLQKFPNLSPNEREKAIAKELGAVFLIGIGGALSNGKYHDVRAPDYDDWSSPNGMPGDLKGLNGDIIVWNPMLQDSFEISSMGIRVDSETLRRQMKICNREKDLEQPFHQALLQGKLPQTIGGGIGQSRIVMLMLQKKHIAEVQVGVWPKTVKDQVGDELMAEDEEEEQENSPPWLYNYTYIFIARSIHCFLYPLFLFGSLFINFKLVVVVHYVSIIRFVTVCCGITPLVALLLVNSTQGAPLCVTFLCSFSLTLSSILPTLSLSLSLSPSPPHPARLLPTYFSTRTYLFLHHSTSSSPPPPSSLPGSLGETTSGHLLFLLSGAAPFGCYCCSPYRFPLFFFFKKFLNIYTFVCCFVLPPLPSSPRCRFFLGDGDALNPQRYAQLLEQLLLCRCHAAAEADEEQEPSRPTVGPPRRDAAVPHATETEDEGPHPYPEHTHNQQPLGCPVQRSTLLCLRLAAVVQLYQWVMRDDIFEPQLQKFVCAVSAAKELRRRKALQSQRLYRQQQQAEKSGGSASAPTTALMPSVVDAEAAEAVDALRSWRALVSCAFCAAASLHKLSPPAEEDDRADESGAAPRPPAALRLFLARLMLLTALPRELYALLLRSDAERAYRAAHGALACWERRHAAYVHLPGLSERHKAFEPMIRAMDEEVLQEAREAQTAAEATGDTTLVSTRAGEPPTAPYAALSGYAWDLEGCTTGTLEESEKAKQGGSLIQRIFRRIASVYSKIRLPTPSLVSTPAQAGGGSPPPSGAATPREDGQLYSAEGEVVSRSPNPRAPHSAAAAAAAAEEEEEDVRVESVHLEIMGSSPPQPSAKHHRRRCHDQHRNSSYVKTATTDEEEEEEEEEEQSMLCIDEEALANFPDGIRPEELDRLMAEYKALECRLLDTFKHRAEGRERQLVRDYHALLGNWATETKLFKLEDLYGRCAAQRREGLLLLPSSDPTATTAAASQPLAFSISSRSPSAPPAAAEDGEDHHHHHHGSSALPAWSFAPTDNTRAAFSAAQLSLPFIFQAAHENWVRSALADDGEVARRKRREQRIQRRVLRRLQQRETGCSGRGEEEDDDEVVEEEERAEDPISTSAITSRVQTLRWLNDPTIFQHWLLACLTADHPVLGPNRVELQLPRRAHQQRHTKHISSSLDSAAEEEEGGEAEAVDSTTAAPAVLPYTSLASCLRAVWATRLLDEQRSAEEQRLLCALEFLRLEVEAIEEHQMEPSRSSGRSSSGLGLGNNSFRWLRGVRLPFPHLSHQVRGTAATSASASASAVLVPVPAAVVSPLPSLTPQPQGAGQAVAPSRSRSPPPPLPPAAAGPWMAAPRVSPQHRHRFASEVAAALHLPSFLLLVNVAYRYHEFGVPDVQHEGRFDAVLYDETNEKVLLVIMASAPPTPPTASSNSPSPSAARGCSAAPPSLEATAGSTCETTELLLQRLSTTDDAMEDGIGEWLKRKQEMWRVVSVLRTCLEAHAFRAAAEEEAEAEAEAERFCCTGVVAEFFFDPPTAPPQEESESEEEEEDREPDDAHGGWEWGRRPPPRDPAAAEALEAALEAETEAGADGFLRGHEEQFFCVMAPAWMSGGGATPERVSIPLHAWRDAVRLPPRYFRMSAYPPAAPSVSPATGLRAAAGAAATGREVVSQVVAAAAVGGGGGTFPLLRLSPMGAVRPGGLQGVAAAAADRSRSSASSPLCGTGRGGMAGGTPPPSPSSASPSSLRASMGGTQHIAGYEGGELPQGSALAAFRRHVLEAAAYAVERSTAAGQHPSAEEIQAAEAAAATKEGAPPALETILGGLNATSYDTSSYMAADMYWHHALALLGLLGLAEAGATPSSEWAQRMTALLTAVQRRDETTTAADVPLLSPEAEGVLEQIRLHCLDRLHLLHMEGEGEEQSAAAESDNGRVGAGTMLVQRRHRALVHDGVEAYWLWRLGDRLPLDGSAARHSSSASLPVAASGRRSPGCGGLLTTAIGPGGRLSFHMTANTSDGDGAVGGEEEEEDGSPSGSGLMAGSRRSAPAASFLLSGEAEEASIVGRHSHHPAGQQPPRLSGGSASSCVPPPAPLTVPMRSPLQVLADLLRRHGCEHPVLDAARKRVSQPPFVIAGDPSAEAAQELWQAVQRRRRQLRRRLRDYRRRQEEHAAAGVSGRPSRASRQCTPRASATLRRPGSTALYSAADEGMEDEDDEPATAWF